MLLLALDTATETGSLALVAGDQVLLERCPGRPQRLPDPPDARSGRDPEKYRQGSTGANRRSRERRPRQLYGAADRAGHRQDPGLVPQMPLGAGAHPGDAGGPGSRFTPTPSGWSWTPSAGKFSGGCSGARKTSPRCWKGRCVCRWLTSGPVVPAAAAHRSRPRRPLRGAQPTRSPGDRLGPAGNAPPPGLHPGPAGPPPPGRGPHRQPRPTGPHLSAPGVVIKG